MKQAFSRRVDVRPVVVAILAVAFGGWALLALAPLDNGTWARIGPGMVPRAIAMAVVVLGLVVLASSAADIASAPPRLLPRPWRLAALAPLVLSLVLALVIGLIFLRGLGPDPHLAEIVLTIVGRPAVAVVGLGVLACTATGTAVALPASRVWRVAVLLLLVLPFLLLELAALSLQPDVVALLGDLPIIASLAGEAGGLALKAGPPDIFAVAWLRWTLVIALGVVVMGTGLRIGLISLLAGALAGLAGTDIATGQQRLFALDMLTDEYLYGVELVAASIMILMAFARVNPVPAYVAFVSAPIVEEQFRRTMLLSHGDPLSTITARPIALSALAVTALIILAVAWYRWPWRSSGSQAMPGSGC